MYHLQWHFSVVMDIILWLFLPLSGKSAYNIDVVDNFMDSFIELRGAFQKTGAFRRITCVMCLKQNLIDPMAPQNGISGD